MLRTMFHAKIHRATVTQADLHYVGSVTVDQDLLDAADILPGELVSIVDVTNGARLETYTIAGERGSGVLGINGAAVVVRRDLWTTPHRGPQTRRYVLAVAARLRASAPRAAPPGPPHDDGVTRPAPPPA